jgi:uncharacterized membrane protein YfcA
MSVFSKIPGNPGLVDEEDRLKQLKQRNQLFKTMVWRLIFAMIFISIVLGALSLIAGANNVLNPVSIIFAAAYVLYMVNRPLSSAKRK